MFYTRYMRLFSRTIDGDLLRDMLPLGAGMCAIGVSFGATTVAAGLPWWVPCLMSVIVFSGGAQFLAVGIVTAGGGALAAVSGGLLLNARHVPFGLALSDVFGRRIATRLLGAHILLDESTAFSLSQRDPRRAKTAYWVCGITVFTTWNIGTVLGVAAGQAIGDPAVLGVDAAFPAALLALTMPSLAEKPTLRAAVLGAVIAVVTTPYLPGGVPVLLALVGMAVAWPGRTSEETEAETRAEAPR